MNRRTVLGAALALPCLPLAARAQGETGSIDLSRYPVGPLPPEFLTTWRMGKSAAGDWRMVEDATASQGKAIAQVSADPTDYRFPLPVHEPLSPRDVEAGVRFKAISGRGDRAGGLAVRLTDADNYYVVRANALENNVRLYRVVRGDRQQLASASATVSPGAWHTLTLRVEGDRLSASFDGKPLLTHSDRTFTGSGKVALWTKADSVTRFDRLDIRPLQ
jgi:hypothetical protein